MVVMHQWWCTNGLCCPTFTRGKGKGGSMHTSSFRRCALLKLGQWYRSVVQEHRCVQVYKGVQVLKLDSWYRLVV